MQCGGLQSRWPYRAPHRRFALPWNLEDASNHIFLWEFQGATRLGATGLRGSERENGTLRGSLRGSLRGRVSEVFRGFERFSEVLRGF